MLCLVGWARARARVRPLRPSAELDAAAEQKAEAITACDEFSHTPCGRPFRSFFERAGYARSRPWSTAEVLAFGSRRLVSARQVFRLWLASPVHRTNLLVSDWRDVGVALVWAGDGPNAEATWVVDLGRRR